MKSEFLYPDKFIPCNKLILEVVEDKNLMIDEVWFHELRDENNSVLEADVRQTRSVIVDVDLWNRLSSIYETNMKKVYNNNNIISFFNTMTLY
jgi:hypothetical protein